MPIVRDSVINISSEHLRPASVTNDLGNVVPDGADVLVKTCLAGAFPRSLRRDPYLNVEGGELNRQRWWVGVIGSPTLAEGDAVHIPTGDLPGKYRVQNVQRAPREPIVLALCIREATT